MVKALTIAFASFVCSSAGFAAQVALPPEMDERCLDSIASLQRSAQDVHRVAFMRVSSLHLSETYDDGFVDTAPYNLVVVLDGPEVDGFMTNDQQLHNLAERTLRQCRVISALTFGVANTDWLDMFGIVNREVRRFECIAPGAEHELAWGQTYCI